MLEQQSKSKKLRPRWLVIILRTLPHFRVPVLCIIAVIVGLWIGYVKVGHQPTSEMFKIRTWKHLYDLVFMN